MIKLLGLPTDINSSFIRGPAAAPDAIRQVANSGSSNFYSEDGSKIINNETYLDLGDMVYDETLSSEAIHMEIVKKIEFELDIGNKVIFLGGDHAVTYPIIQAYAKQYTNLNILHFDAHPDLYHSFQNNPYSHASPFARIMENKLARSLTQVGIRTLDAHQRNQVRKFGVTMVEMKDFNMDFINDLQGPLYISIDLDALDPSCAPGVSHHEPGGINMRDMLTIIQSISVPIVGADIVEYNPSRDINNMTAMVAYKLFKELLAKLLTDNK
ncbi:MAG: agmatinase family protein [Alcanivoracaceae bacterium]|nr:agmatinase family protein [Alcanivoracaceae bacterium]